MTATVENSFGSTDVCTADVTVIACFTTADCVGSASECNQITCING